MEAQRINDLNEVKSRFFSNVSHEFRTPLSLIIGPLKRSVQNNDSTGRMISEKNYNTITRNAQRLQHLVDQLLDLSKLESGHLEVILEKGDINSVIRSLLKDFENLASEKSITFDYQLISIDSNVYFDEDKVVKILNNLLSNAFKYTPSDGKVNFIFETKLHENLTFIINDTGKGIDQSELKNIFQRFYRIESTEAKGSGIGLALTHELIERLGGEIQVESTKGAGTSFKVTIPIDLQLIPKPFQLLSPEIISDENVILNDTNMTSTIQSETDDNVKLPLALIVEDNNDLSQFISEILKKEYNVIIAQNGEEGEEMAIRFIPNIIVSDVMMPKRNGYEMCERLKSNIKTSHIPIILLTAKAGQENKMSGLTQGADAYMTKPFEESELLIRMNNLIQARKAMWEQFKSVLPSFSDDIKLDSMDDQFFKQVQECVFQNLSNETFTVEDLANSVGFSKSQLHRKLKAITNKTPNQIIRENRLNKAKFILESKSMTVSETAFSVGYSNLSYFSKIFKEEFGQLPSDI